MRKGLFAAMLLGELEHFFNLNWVVKKTIGPDKTLIFICKKWTLRGKLFMELHYRIRHVLDTSRL